jgi:hypothetical protein
MGWADDAMEVDEEDLADDSSEEGGDDEDDAAEVTQGNISRVSLVTLLM